MACYVAQGRDELVEVWIYAWAAHEFDASFRLATVGHAQADLLVGLAHKLADAVSKDPGTLDGALTALNK